MLFNTDSFINVKAVIFFNFSNIDNGLHRLKTQIVSQKIWMSYGDSFFFFFMKMLWSDYVVIYTIKDFTIAFTESVWTKNNKNFVCQY